MDAIQYKFPELGDERGSVSGGTERERAALIRNGERRKRKEEVGKGRGRNGPHERSYAKSS